MSVNRRRGEVAAELDDKHYRLCLTLGALAELEAAYQAEDLGALVERFASARLSARDLIRIVGAGLRGGGNDIADAEVANMQAADGAAGFASIVSELLTATFGTNAGAGSEAAMAAGSGGAETARAVTAAAKRTTREAAPRP